MGAIFLAFKIVMNLFKGMIDKEKVNVLGENLKNLKSYAKESSENMKYLGK